MFIKKLKQKAVSGLNVAKNNVRRVVSRAPKMKFFYGRYYKKGNKKNWKFELMI